MAIEKNRSKYPFSDLDAWGWSGGWSEKYAAFERPERQPARVLSADRGSCRLRTVSGEARAALSGKLLANAGEGWPIAVGDWVVVETAGPDLLVADVLPRNSEFTRQSAGRMTRRQIIAANIDTVFLMAAVDRDFNLRRLERYLVVTWESGARPVVLLSKADLSSDVQLLLDEVNGIAPGIPVHPVSSASGAGLEDLNPYLAAGQTVALLGSSGVGKSTLVNTLMGEELLATSEIREKDGRGRHTTSRRQLLSLPGGALVIDTPGLRELLPWDAGEGLERVFDDIETLAAACRFSDCAHESEPDCAVREALEQGTLDPARFENYAKLQREQAFQARRRNEREAQAHQRKQKQFHKLAREIIKEKNRRRLRHQ